MGNLQKYKARPYQKECLAKIAEAVNNGEKRALVVMASGLGKTITSAMAAEQFFGNRAFGRTLILCHSEQILSQSKDKFKDYFGEEYSYGMYVGSERTMRQTDFLFATFQTMKEHRKEFCENAFSYVIVDEAHHSHACTYFPTIRYFQPEFLLGLTATPDRLDGQDIEEIYGAPVYELDFIEAMNRGLLTGCDYQLVLDDMSQEKLDEYIQSEEKTSIAQLNRTVFAPKRDEEIVRLIQQYSAEQKDPKTIIFCKSIEHARRIAKLMGDEATLVHNGQSGLMNDMALEAFRCSKNRTIISVQMLNEGIDVPDANIIVFLRNTISETIFYQQLGRGTRLSPGKDKVKVLDFVANCERIQTVLNLKQKVDQFKGHSINDNFTRDSGDADSREKFTLNIATPEFKTKMVDIINIFENIRVQQKWTQEVLIKALQQKASEIGHTPTQSEINSDEAMPYSAYYVRFFGSYNAAIEAAGLQPNKTSIMLTNDEMLKKLKALANKLGHRPTFNEIKAEMDMPCPATYVRRFGSMDNAISEAGITQTRYYSDSELLSMLFKKAQTLGRTPTAKDIKKDDNMPGYDVYRKRFGGLAQALKMANMDIRTKMISDFQKLAKKLGRTPLTKDLGSKNNTACATKYIKEFGSWDALLAETGCKDVRKRYSQDSIYTALKTKASELGHWPTSDDLLGDDKLPSPSTVREYFGSIKESIIYQTMGLYNN